MLKTQKRYQFFGKNGIEWSRWFDFNGDTSNEIQLKGRMTLKNEYKQIKILDNDNQN